MLETILNKSTEMWETATPAAKFHEIKVIGVGGAGNNAINRLAKTGITGVDLIAVNTDLQDLNKLSSVPIKVQIGKNLTKGLGAGSKLDVGRAAAIEDIKEIENILDATTSGPSKNTQTVIIVTGMGGGTGSGAAPVIAKCCADRDILTIGIINIPDKFENGSESIRINNAEVGLAEIKQHLDSIIVIDNTKLSINYKFKKAREAYAKADEILYDSVKAIIDIRNKEGIQNIDHADIASVLKKSDKHEKAKVALIGTAKATGENRALDVVKAALDAPLLKDNNISGANWAILVTITNETSDDEGVVSLGMDEKNLIIEQLNKAVGTNLTKKWGYYNDSTYTDEIELIVVVAGFKESEDDLTNPVTPTSIPACDGEKFDFDFNNDENIVFEGEIDFSKYESIRN